VDLVNEQCPGTDLRIGEIGTAHRETSAHLLKYCPQISRIYAVDINKPDPTYDCLTNLERVTFIQGRSDESAGEVEDASLDLVFIDADHSEEAVLRDLEAWVPKVKPGGLIAGHDYGSHNHPGVRSAVEIFFSQHPHPISVETNRVWWTLR
jgi:predicted O-methyltransferase YrrM